MHINAGNFTSSTAMRHLTITIFIDRPISRKNSTSMIFFPSAKISGFFVNMPKILSLKIYNKSVMDKETTIDTIKVDQTFLLASFKLLEPIK